MGFDIRESGRMSWPHGAHHLDVRHRAADMRRQNDVWLSGDRVLRFPAWWMRAHPEEVVNCLRKVLVADAKE